MPPAPSRPLRWTDRELTAARTRYDAAATAYQEARNLGDPAAEAAAMADLLAAKDELGRLALSQRQRMAGRRTP